VPSVPQGLKPFFCAGVYDTAKAVPFKNDKAMPHFRGLHTDAEKLWQADKPISEFKQVFVLALGGGK
jgi:hypothetical protein